MFNRLRSVKNHVIRHRFKYGVATGLTVGGYCLVKQADQWNEFLDANDLWDTFYDYSE